MKGLHVGLGVLLAVSLGVGAAVDPDTSGGTSRAVFVGFLIALILYGVRPVVPDHKGLMKGLMTIAVLGLLFRIPLALLHLAVAYWVYGGEIDLVGFYAHGIRIGREFVEGRFAEAMFGFQYTDSGQLSLAVVHRLCALIYLFVGPSVVGMSLASGLIGFIGSVLFLRAFQIEFPSSHRDSRFLALCLFLFPGLAFWTSLLGKDSWFFLFLGWFSYSAANLFAAARVRHVIGLVVSLTFIVLIRPAIGSILVGGMGAAFLLAARGRMKKSGPVAVLRPAVLICFAAIVLGITTATVSFGPRQSGEIEDTSPVEKMLSIALYRHVGLAHDTSAGGSSLPVVMTDSTLSGVIKFLPQGIFTFLFRPLVFEAHNVLLFVASVDGSLLLFLVLWRRRHLIVAARRIASRPFLCFCWIAFLLLTVGLAFESNFGVIVRHRAMALPFLFLLLAVPTEASDPGRTPSNP